MGDQPAFRFHPDAYEHGCFVASEETCSACGRACVWKYTQHIYALPPEPAAICARCIADGNAASAVPDGDFTLHDMDYDQEPDEALAREVERRTPGFATYNPFVWPVRNGAPLAFLGFGADANLAGIAGVELAVATLARDMGADEINPGDALIFKSLDGDLYVATLDLD